MSYRSHIYPICKITPVFDSIVLEEYVLTVDFYLPLDLINSLEQPDYFTDDFDTHHFSDDASNGHVTEYFPSLTVCPCIINAVNDNYSRKLNIKLDALLFSIITWELRNSKVFRSNVLSNFYSFSRKRFAGQKITCTLCQRLLWILCVTVYLKLPNKNIIDHKWNKRRIFSLKWILKMPWHGCLHWAEKAGLISVQQFRLALRLGDPLTICRCKIYLSMSLLQRGYYRKTKKMIRELYKFSIGPEGSKDFRLKNMCIAVWNKAKI
ncbi:hypothetical protein HNY73_015853 [Argiope bruennichi]|uniref:Uncharacterized protein n=1 Tax=Argiope bruennichi TaxID=94029 RepID=A0A8T0EHB3_ARGBR|nr:hypothetical protein HNY73_015853 [Argiope bruennichi]